MKVVRSEISQFYITSELGDHIHGGICRFIFNKKLTGKHSYVSSERG